MIINSFYFLAGSQNYNISGIAAWRNTEITNFNSPYPIGPVQKVRTNKGASVNGER